MRRYEQVSGAFFLVLALAQLTRVALRWPVQVAGLNIPLWPSVVAVLVTLTLALWALRTARSAA